MHMYGGMIVLYLQILNLDMCWYLQNKIIYKIFVYKDTYFSSEDIYF